MKPHPSTGIIAHFSCIPDPRLNRKKEHKLTDIFFITICAVICGADGWVSVAQFGQAKKEWLTRVLGLKNGIPSHDTFGNVFAVIDTQLFAECFSRWVSELIEVGVGVDNVMPSDIISIDGKCLRGSIDRASKKAAIYMVSAWSQRNQLVLGQHKVDDKSNEISAIPKLLAQLNIEGAVVTMDAMGCQTKIAEQIVERNADYLLSLKGNQGGLHEDVVTLFESDLAPDISHVEYDGGHGRIETRHVQFSTDVAWLKERHPQWRTVNSIVAVTAEREQGDKTTRETRYFISSLKTTNAARLGQIVRAHWGIENNLHWVLDYAFSEDAQRVRKGYSASNMAILRHLALNLLKTEKSIKVGIKTKRLRAGWDENYLLQVLTARPVST